MHMVEIQIVPKDINNEDSLCTHTDTPLNRTTTVRFMYILPKIAYTHTKSKHTYTHVCTLYTVHCPNCPLHLTICLGDSSMIHIYIPLISMQHSIKCM